jgi:hypothetical protein
MSYLLFVFSCQDRDEKIQSYLEEKIFVGLSFVEHCHGSLDIFFFFF